jgi:hypothetical protein
VEGGEWRAALNGDRISNGVERNYSEGCLPCMPESVHPLDAKAKLAAQRSALRTR